MLYELLEDRCISLITGIACLLVYYDFKLTELNQIRYQQCKKLFFMGNHDDFYNIYLKLFELGTSLLDEIMAYYKLVDYKITDVWTYRI